MAFVTDNIDLIESAKKNDEYAWEKLIKDYKIFIYGIILKYHFKHREKKDVFQEIALKLVSAIKDYDPSISRFSTFVSIIANRKCIDILREENYQLFIITDNTLIAMKYAGFSDEIINNLNKIKNHEFTEESKFLEVLEELLDNKADLDISTILKYTKKYKGRYPQTPDNIDIHGEVFNIIDKIYLEEILNNLPADIKKLLIYHCKGYSYNEIAKFMEKDFDWVKNNLFRIKKKSPLIRKK
ncbi:MAG: sigma-70 family RNA polymerase sigma factor [Pseudomonadota bacterium]